MGKRWMALGATCFCISLIWFLTAYGQHSGEMFACFFADTMECKIARRMGGFASFVSGRGPSGSFHPWLTWLSGIFMLMSLFLSNNESESQENEENNDSNTTNSKSHKTCPACAETIKMAAKLCRYCGYEFTDDDIEKEIQIQKKRKIVTKKCSNCGAQIKNNRAVKCENCNVRF